MDRKEQIRDAILKILDTEGVQGLTTASIAKEVGFSDAALYKHFKNKEAIISFALDEMSEIIKTAKAQVERESGNPMENLVSFFRKHLDILEKRPGFYRLVYSDELHLSSKRLMRKLSKIGSMYHNTVKSYLLDAKEEGLIRNDVDAEWLSLAIMGCVQSAFIGHVVLRKEESLSEMTMNMFNTIIKGVTTS